jgi:hypothetical protein
MQRIWTPKKQKREEPEMNFLKSKSEYEICQFVTRKGVIKTA